MDIKTIMNRVNSSLYLSGNDLKVIEITHQYAKASMKLDDNITNPHGYAHGGAVYSIADLAAGAACCYNGRSVVTLTGNINYIKPGKGNYLYAEANITSEGGHTAVVFVTITNEDNLLIATANFTMYFVDTERYDVKK